MNWSKPYYNITHYGTLKDVRRCSINIIDINNIILSKWYKDCGFSPIQSTFNNLEDAKKDGEFWVSNK